MWGNRLGWMIAGAMVLVMVIAVSAAWIISSKRTEPTAFSKDEENLVAIRLPEDPARLLPPRSRTEDAADIYWRAVEDYEKNINEYDRLATTFNQKRAESLAGVAAVLEAADYERADLFRGRIDAAVGYGTRPGVNALHKVGAVVFRLGVEYAKQERFEDARRHLLASYVLGYHLFEQRMTRLQLSAGLGLMAQSATVLKQVETATGNADAAKQYERFVDAYQRYYRERVEPMIRVLTSVDPKVLATHVGDVFAITEKSQERAWRVEGVLKLGMYRYYTNTPGDRRAARRLVKQLVDDPDPAVAAAAVAARDLTLQEYRTIGSK